ncbi:hypothetical protein SAMN05216315_103135 [Nitrosospira sp. Nsp18]|uniref:hypothetical protein n=1 Tax=Nitrosospira sp. Nsp18 TaxID=1855334 RepID=UPI00088954ED|nr:hypothetical protein [Nitrosospira sp. Nsp18]SDA12629.1 hypothetical protein SAMN05216315_103135 [Nitrosospira sp. Nsp18]
MATFSAADLSSKARHMGGYGNTVVAWGSVAPTAGASGDIYRPLIIPAGIEVTDVDIVNDKLDSNATPAIAFKAGYAPVYPDEGPAASDAYFTAAGNTVLRNAGRASLAFQPVKFEKPVYLTITLTTAAASFAPGKVTAIVKGDAVGVK